MCKEMYRDALIFPTPSGRPHTLMVTSKLSLETIVLDHPGSRFNAKHGTKYSFLHPPCIPGYVHDTTVFWLQYNKVLRA